MDKTNLDLFSRVVAGVAESPLSPAVRDACIEAWRALCAHVPNLGTGDALAPEAYLDPERAVRLVRPGLFSVKKRTASAQNARTASAARRHGTDPDELRRERRLRSEGRASLVKSLRNPKDTVRLKALRRLEEKSRGDDPEILTCRSVRAVIAAAAASDPSPEVRAAAAAIRNAPPPFAPLREFASDSGASYATLKSLCEKGMLPGARRIGTKWFVPHTERKG
jgi:hypothetical protein